MVDPCFTTTLSVLPGSIENFVGFAGYVVKSLATYTLSDSVSLAKTLLTDPGDFCGPKAF